MFNENTGKKDSGVFHIKNIFKKEKHKSLSKELTEILLSLGLIEHQGFGVPYIVRLYGKEAYNISKNVITLTIPYNFIDSRIATDVKVDETLEEKIIALINVNNKITRNEMAEILGVSLASIKRVLSTSVIISRKGNKMSGNWVINKN